MTILEKVDPLVRKRVRVSVGSEEFFRIRASAQNDGISINELCRYRCFCLDSKKYEPIEQATRRITLYFSVSEVKFLLKVSAGLGMNFHDFLRGRIASGDASVINPSKNTVPIQRRIRINGSSEELEMLFEKIRESGFSVGRFFLNAGLGNKLPSRNEIQGLSRLISGIGRNLNQISIAIHQGRVDKSCLEEMIGEIKELKGELQGFLCQFSK